MSGMLPNGVREDYNLVASLFNNASHGLIAKGVFMFDSLSDRIREDENQGKSAGARWMYWLSVLVVSLLVFGGLFLGVRLLE